MKKTLLALSVSLISTSVLADVRTAAMGGAGVASSNYLSAPFVNPALLADYKDSDDFGLLLPSIQAIVSDSNDLVDKVDALQASYESLDALIASGDISNLSAIQSGATQLSSDFSALSGTSANVEGNLAFALSIPNKYLATTVFAQTSFDISSNIIISDSDVALLDGIASASVLPTDLNALTSSAMILGASVSEFGISLAKNFEFNDYSYSFGVSPKYQRVDTFNYIVDVESFDQDNFDSDQYTNDNGNFNVDVGASVSLSDSWKFGLVGKDLIKETYQTIDLNGQSFSYEIAPKFTAGIAYNSSVLNASFDIDLNETKKFDLDDETQFARIGAEINAFDWAKIRVGYRHDLKDNKEDLITAGLGFSPFDVVHLDVTAMYADGDEYGLGVQTSFTF
jgi:hypothetical protein